MQVALDERDGSQEASRNIHIEHTVPACTLVRALERRIDHFAAPSDLHNYLMQHSVCVAFSYTEQRAMRGLIARHSTPAFDKTGDQLCDRPFLRYTPFLEGGVEFEVVNVVTGEAVGLERFTFADHVRTLQCASRLVENQPDGGDLYYASRFPAEVWRVT